jgi:hypothetical protein
MINLLRRHFSLVGFLSLAGSLGRRREKRGYCFLFSPLVSPRLFFHRETIPHCRVRLDSFLQRRLVDDVDETSGDDISNDDGRYNIDRDNYHISGQSVSMDGIYHSLNRTILYQLSRPLARLTGKSLVFIKLLLVLLNPSSYLEK